MKALAIKPGVKNSVHTVDVPTPKVSDVENGRGVLVKVTMAGLCGTDREINDGEYGIAPSGSDLLILGHENLGKIEDIDGNVTEFHKNDLVVATVRRPGGNSVYDRIGEPHFTTESIYFEHGISRLHGFMSEYYVENADDLVQVPASLAEIGVLLEPLSIVEKGLKQADDIQTRLKIWQPKTAAVLGTGNVGLLCIMALRMRGYAVHGFGLDDPEGYLNAELCRAIGATYDSTATLDINTSTKTYGEYDLVFECTGYSPIIFDAMQSLNENGVLILSSVTGGQRLTDQVPSDKINQMFVLGNRAMVGTVNAGREHFEMGVKDMALCEAMYPGWLKRLMTHKIEGFERFAEAFEILNNPKKYKAIKTYFDLSDL